MPVITDSQRRAICKVFVPGTAERGTGFLIANNRVMTAAHVVAAKDKAKPYAGENIELIFGHKTPEGPRVVTKVKVGEHFDPTTDWAVLELTAEEAKKLSDVRPFRLREPAIVADLQWDTFGYSNAEPDQGKPYGGEIRTDASVFHLYVEPTQGDPSGLSGSPCLVDGEAIGVIIESPKQKQVTDSLDVRSMLSIREAGLTEPRVLPRSQPYAKYVAGRIRPFEAELWATAAALGLANDADEAEKIIVRARLPRCVALEMMSGTDATLTSLRSLKRALKNFKDEPPLEVARDLLERAARAWIDPAAIKLLRQALDKQQLVILNTDSVRVVEWYLHRLNWMEDTVNPDRYERAFCVDPSTPAHDAVLRAFDEVVLRELGNEHPSAEAALAAHSHDDEPLVAWFRGLPQRKTVDALRDRRGGYEQVRLLFMVGSQPPAQLKAEYSDGVILKPPPLPADVERALGALEEGLKKVRKLFEVKGSAV